MVRLQVVLMEVVDGAKYFADFLSIQNDSKLIKHDFLSVKKLHRFQLMKISIPSLRAET